MSETQATSARLQHVLCRSPEWIIVALLAIVILCTFRDYGISWDEYVQAQYGELVLDYFASGGSDKAANSYKNLMLYGPLFELMAAVANAPFDSGYYQLRHLLNAITGLLALVGTILFARLFDRRWLPLIACIALACLPRFYGHWFANSKDIPFACAFIWALWGIGRLFVYERFRWRDASLAGALIGCALAIRVGAFLLICFLLAATLTWLIATCTRDQARWKATLSRIAFAKAATLLAIAWTIMVIVWPWAHQNPILNPIRAFLEATNFAQAYPVLFEGQSTLSSDLPAYYVPKYLLITTPMVPLLLAIIGTILAVRALIAERRPAQLALLVLTGLWLLFPITFVVITRPNVYDGIRHFLFVLPALAIAAGYGADALITRLPAPKQCWALGICIAMLLLPLGSMVALHPYQTTYFNPLVGGLRQACLSYETDYWTTSYKEAAEWLNQQPRPVNRPMVVLIAANTNNLICARYYLDKEIVLVPIWGHDHPLPSRFDYFVATTRNNAARLLPELPTAHVVGRQGAMFTIIRTTAQPIE